MLDLTWAMAGPATTRVMADFGATVIRIETSTKLDVARTIGPFVNDVPGNDSSGLLFNMTTGKRSISLDLRQELGQEVLDDLVRWADVVIESFSPRGRASLGLDYERLHDLRPGLIMMSSCLFGQTGPLRRYAGFGTMGASLSGFFHLTGWPDRPPCGPFGAYSDYPSPRFALCAVLAALDHRDRTGEGQYLDFAQAEACVHFLSPALLDHAVNGHEWTRNGNADPEMAPHGVYPAAATTSGSPSPAATTPTGGRSPSWSVAATWRRWAPRTASPGARSSTRSSPPGPPHGHPTMSPPSLSPPACPPTPCRTPASAWTTRSWPTSGTG